MSVTISLKFGRWSRLLSILFLFSLGLWLFTAVPPSNAAVDAQFIKHSIDDNFAYVGDINLADMDGDDDLDVIAATPVTGASGLSWWENETGNGTYWDEQIVCPGDRGAYTAIPADLDGDGDLDILASLTGEDDIMWFENQDGTATSWTEHRILSHEFDNDILLAVDIDDDNDLDILAGLTYNGEIAWWENMYANATRWRKHVVALGLNFPSALAAADIDNDDDLDLLSGTYYDGQIAWWENLDGNGRSWLKHFLDGGFDQPYAIGAADMDMNGTLDIYSAARGDDKITWWRNIYGNGHLWDTHLVAEMYDQPRDVVAVDIDADNDMDLVGVSAGLDQVTLWENVAGTGTTWRTIVLDDKFKYASAVTTGDIDGDNDVDIAAAALNDLGFGDNIAWWEQHPPYFVVNSTGDGADAQVGNGICDDGSGFCTLRAALMEANASGGTDSIHFNIPGTGAHVIQPQTALPLLAEAVIIDGYTQPGAQPNTNPAPMGLNTRLMIVLDGSQAGSAFGFSWGLDSSLDGLVIRGLAIHSFSNGAIGSYYEELYDVMNARFVGNFIGTDVTGTEARGGGSGIVLAGGPRFKNIDIGGVIPEDRNLINGGVGIYSRYAEMIQIQGNLMGTDISGQLSLGNGYGVHVRDGCPILIGGAESGASNVISGGHTHAIGLDGNDGCTTIRSNLIGVAADGMTPIGNSGDGIHAFEHAGMVVENNYIAYNQGNGLTIGIYNSSNIISNNVISGNSGDGIRLEGSNNYAIIQGNLIGLAADGQTPLGNGGSGIYAVEHRNVKANENRIAYNQGNGLSILQGNAYITSYFTTTSPNAIFSNVGLGIDLLNDGVTPNDPLDSDAGPNGLQNFPTLFNVVHSSSNVIITGNLHSWPNRTYTIWLFTNAQCDPSGYGEGEAFAAELVVTTDGGGNAPFTAVFPQQPERPFVTATASYNGAISEFAQCRADPIYLVTLLRAEVQQLIDDGVLPALAGVRLLAKLDNVEAALLAGHENTAFIRLQDFIASVRNLMNQRQLPHELGQPLIDAAWAIIHQINLP